MITNISTLPAVPNRNDPGTFSNKADSFLGAMPTLVSELNSFVSEVNTLSFKTACKVATTTNLSSLVYPTVSSIDGVSINTGDRVLVKNQNNVSQNGIYTVAGSNITWTRAADMDTEAEVAGSFVPITFGVQNGGKIYYTTFNATGGVIGTTDIPWNSLTEGSITGIGTVAVANGGTGISSYAVGDLLYASGTASLAKLAAAAAGNVLKSGTAPSWGKVALASDVSGTLPASNGGTGLTGPGSIGNVLTSGGGGWVSSPISLPSASTSAAGIVELATTAEAQTGTDTVRAITPATMRSGLNASGSAPVYACRAWANFSAANISGTYSQSGTTITVTMTSHGMSTGDKLYLDFTSGAAADGFFTITSVTTNTFTITSVLSQTASGNVTRQVYLKNNASGNIASITYNGTNALYRATFATALEDDNFAWSGSSKGNGPNPQWIICGTSQCTRSSSYIEFELGNSSNAFNDTPLEVSIIVFR